MEIENFFRIGYTMGFLRYGGALLFLTENIIHTQSPLRGMEYSIKFNVNLKSYRENP